MATDIIDKILAPSHTLYDKGSKHSAQMGDLNNCTFVRCALLVNEQFLE